MDEPHVHLLLRRSAEYGGRIGPLAFAAGVGGFLIWLISLDALPSVGAIGWVVGLCGMTVALSSALASSVGLLARTGRRLAARPLLTSALRVLGPAAVAFFVISFFWN
ncbi:MAG: hypothetical protein K0S82_996 [Gaiellaceae bacterium]|jgi:hypothetical protein|nr:hypothetical protein [Gaiellaceae bacterium]